jgi:hypothetical protein
MQTWRDHGGWSQTMLLTVAIVEAAWESCLRPSAGWRGDGRSSRESFERSLLNQFALCRGIIVGLTMM